MPILSTLDPKSSFMFYLNNLILKKYPFVPIMLYLLGNLKVDGGIMVPITTTLDPLNSICAP